MRRFLSPWRAGGVIVLLAVLAVLVMYTVPSGAFPGMSDQYLLLPDVAHPVSPLVRVQDARPVKRGTLYFVDVIERRASTLEALFPSLHPHGSLEPAGSIVPPCSTATQAEEAQLQAMAFSQRVAAAVALRQLGYHVVVRPSGVVVAQLIGGTNAPCNLQPMDVIVAVDGIRTPTVAALRRVLAPVKPGNVVVLRVRRAGHMLTLRIRTVAVPQAPGQALVGFAPDQAATIKLPIRVSIDASGIGGPSAGLAFALEVMQKLGRNVLRGHQVAATGEMELNGSVGPIGGVKQKTYGVRQAGADVFLVPAGDNARVARRYAGPLRIIPVHTFKQALRALATLPRAGKKA
ncbi:MAG TPA: S16 family serine protease [Gaiellaceae bacterium]|nr:S16 family serine protease [Gaiellaceae bacterium]